MVLTRCPPVPLDGALYRRIQARARRRFVWPSIYANAWVVRAYKKSGGRYRSSCRRKAQGRQGLRKWFREQWVDLSRPLGPGRWASCGRPSAKSGRYPKCVPLARARRMTKAQIKSAIRRKRKAERNHRGGRALRVKTIARARKRRNPSTPSLSRVTSDAIPILAAVLASRAIVRRVHGYLPQSSVGAASRPMIAAGLMALGAAISTRSSTSRVVAGLAVNFIAETISAVFPSFSLS